jgi:hypothetical protein
MDMAPLPFTTVTYQHVRPDMQAETARIFAALLEPASVPPSPPGGTAGGTRRGRDEAQVN